MEKLITSSSSSDSASGVGGDCDGTGDAASDAGYDERTEGEGEGEADETELYSEGAAFCDRLCGTNSSTIVTGAEKATRMHCSQAMTAANHWQTERVETELHWSEVERSWTVG